MWENRAGSEAGVVAKALQEMSRERGTGRPGVQGLPTRSLWFKEKGKNH